MKKVFALLASLLVATVSLYAQDEKPARGVYTTSGGELIFSLANMNYNGADLDPVVRFSPVFNFQNLVHFDKGNGRGIFTGLSFRNVGFIYDNPDDGARYKVRTYNLGVPIGFNFGNNEGFHVYGGYELEIPLNYKEKKFVDESKEDKFNTWFSKRTNLLNSSLFVGVQLREGANIKFKYYLTNFYDKDYTQSDGNKPYENFDVNVFYFSLTFDLFQNDQFTFDDQF
jgi:hypothetical protein